MALHTISLFAPETSYHSGLVSATKCARTINQALYSDKKKRARCICAQRKSINPFYHQSKLACTKSIGFTQLCSLCVRTRAILGFIAARCRCFDKRDWMRNFRGPRIYAPRASGFSVLLIIACNSE